MKYRPNFTIIDHPVMQDKITKIRDTKTNVKEFRELISEISTLLCYEALRDAPLTKVTGYTPMGPYEGGTLKDYAIVPIYRAGLGMEEGVIHILPNAKVGHIGMYRDPSTHNPHTYYHKLPAGISGMTVLLLDPMLATGGSACESAKILKEHGAKVIKFLCVVSCEVGVERLMKEHSDIKIYSAAHDLELDKNAYIVPGLGDAGDRIFGTK